MAWIASAVIVRRLGTGRVIGMNAAAINVFGAANEASSVDALG
jgi:hypothetical protein